MNNIKTNQLMEQELFSVEMMLEECSIEEIYIAYAKLINSINNSTEVDSNIKVKIYTSFAYFLFHINEFHQFFEICKDMDKYEKLSVELEELIFKAFLQPNLNEFEKNYNANMDYLISKGYLHSSVRINFEQLPYYLLPTGTENEYYIYNKDNKVIKERISLFSFEKVENLGETNFFSSYLILENANWYNILTSTNSLAVNNRVIYFLLNDVGKFISCLQGALLDESILSNVVLFESVNRMIEYFHMTNDYLPRNVIDLTNQNGSIQETLKTIYNLRIQDKTRKRNNILLSICIPTFNRGDRALANVLDLLKLELDDEIEIVVSNNGTKNHTKVEYNKIKEINDARLVYHEFDENQGFAVNCCKVSELASGQYILFLSDEDFIDHNILNNVLKVLYDAQGTLAVVKTSDDNKLRLRDSKKNAGSEAILEYMLTSNYMSGLIFNNKILKQHGGLEYVKNNLANRFVYWYPHMVWEIFLCQYGDAQSMSQSLIKLGKPEKTDGGTQEIVGLEKITIPDYSTIEDRLLQHKGAIETFKDLEICCVNPNFLSVMYLHMCNKTFYLIEIAIKLYYLSAKFNIREIIDNVYKTCSDKEYYFANISNNPEFYKQDLDTITLIYNKSLKRMELIL